MPTVPLPLLGRHLVSATLTPLTVGSGGALTAGSPINILSKHQAHNYHGQVEREEINGTNTTRRNEVVLSDGASLTIEIFKVNDGTDGDPLLTLWQTTDYFEYQWVEGTATGSIQTCVFYGVRGDLTTGMTGRGKQIAQLELGPVDIGGAQFTRTLS